MQRNSLSYAMAIFSAANIDAAYFLQALPLWASLAEPSLTAVSIASTRDSAFGANMNPSSSSTTTVPFMLGNLEAITGFPLIIASISVRSSPWGLRVGLRKMSIEL